MRISAFNTTTSGKWILAGEHSVLRGVPALVFPLESRQFELQFAPSKETAGIQVNEDSPVELDLAGPFWTCFKKACEVFQVNPEMVSGRLTIRSEIPAGAGLGASAALSVALARWFSDMKGEDGEGLSHQARLLENVFHGESSGVDVTVVSEEKPLLYTRTEGFRVVETHWKPRMYLSYSGVQGMTKACVEKVQSLKTSNPSLLESLDRQMRSAVELAAKALSQKTTEEGFDDLKKAIEMASDCFHQWGLVSPQMEQHLAKLKICGSVATKPTGSGHGGYCLSLWKDEPPESLKEVLIPCFS